MESSTGAGSSRPPSSRANPISLCLSLDPAAGWLLHHGGDARRSTGAKVPPSLACRQLRLGEIRRPAQLKADEYPPGIALYAVEAKEVNPPLGQQPVHWRLLTTHRGAGLESALQMLQWDGWRWRIEQLFATLKLAGLDIESTQLASVAAIQRLTLLALSVAVRTLQLVEGRDNIQIPAALAFTDLQRDCLLQIAPPLEGRTQKQQNPYPLASLPWATWIIARLGGWSAYRSQRPPGMPTLVHGLRRFEAIFMGWKTALDGLVCTR